MSELLTVRFVGPVRRPGPERTMEVDPAEIVSVRELLERLGYDAEEQRSVQVLVDGRRVGPEAGIARARTVEILIAIGGG